MPRYMFKVSYSADGAVGLRDHGGVARKEAISAMFERMGGALESFDYSLGEEDAYLVAELPGAEAVAAMSITVAAGRGARVTSQELLTPEQLDHALEADVVYQAPGG